MRRRTAVALVLLACIGCDDSSSATTGRVTGLVHVNRADESCIFSLAATVGIEDIDHLVEPNAGLSPSDDYCVVVERSRHVAPAVRQSRRLTVVRETNTRYDGYEPGTWLHRCGWKTTPALMHTLEFHQLVAGGRDIELQLLGKDPVSPSEATAIVAALAGTLQSATGNEATLLAGCRLDQLASIERPITTAPEILPDPGVIGHDGPGHQLAEAVFSDSDRRSGRSVVVCVEKDHICILGSTSWQVHGAMPPRDP